MRFGKKEQKHLKEMEMRIFLAVVLFSGLALFSGCSKSACSIKSTRSCYAPVTDYYDYKPASYYKASVSEFDSGPGYYDIVQPATPVAPAAKPESQAEVQVEVITNSAAPTCDPCSSWRKGLSS